MRKTHTALLVMAALVVAAFAAPAAASADYWTEEGHPLEETVEFSMSSGAFTREGPVFGMKCGAVNAQVRIGEAVSEMPTISFTKCEGTGAMAGIKMTATPEGLPWAVQPKALSGKVIINTGTLQVKRNDTGAGVGGVSGSSYWELTPNSPEAISSFKLLGSTVWGMTDKATFSVSPAGQYGFE
jgi:hypothetical protein